MTNVSTLKCRVKWRLVCVNCGLIISVLGLAAGQLHAQLPVSGKLVWFKADVGVENAFGGTPPAGGAVAVWRDQSGNGFDATPLDPGNAPAFQMNSNFEKNSPHPVIRWEESRGMGLDVPGASLAADQESTYVVIFDSTNDTGNRRFIDFTRGGFRNYSKGYTGGSSVFPENGTFFDGVRAYNGSRTINNKPHVGVLRSEADNVQHFVDGALDSLSLFYNPGGSSTPPEWKLGAASQLRIGIQGAGNPYVGDLAEVIIYDRALSNSEVADVQSYALNKYGVPEPSTLVLLLGMGSLLFVRCARRRHRH